jgi:signal peptidase
MEPTMSGGDIILYTDHTEISEGDVIVFENDKQDVMVGHRVIEIKGEEYITKGDNNSRPDPVVVTDENVEGKIIYHIPTPF